MPKSWLVRNAESADRARRRMELTGVTPNGHPLWQRWEVDPVVGIYPNYRTIFPLLERRTRPAVYNKAGRLGIVKERAPPWSDNEILRLRKVYPTGTREEILAAFPGRTYRAVAAAANKRRIYRAAPALVPSGIRILDQILLRAARLSQSLADLDRLGGRPSYFTRRRWRTKPDHVVHCRTVQALGGQLRVDFSR